MGVYLPNVDMPKDDKCVTIQICPDGSIWQQYRGTVPNAKAVPVPPHGRLIDADALEDNNITYYAIPVLANVTDGTIREAELVIRLKDLDDAPTIIEANSLPVLHGTFAASSKEEAKRRLTGESET